MKFITEVYLRSLYRKGEFTQFVLEEGMRVTPGAREFLSDRRITLVSNGDSAPQAAKKQGGSQTAPKMAGPAPGVEKFIAQVRFLENSFLLTSHTLMAKDIHLAQRVGELTVYLAAMKGLVGGQTPSDIPRCTACTGIHPDNVDQDLGVCFEITPFHLQAPQIFQVLHLNKLRCAIGKLKVEAPSEALPGLNRIYNLLSQLICTALGGNECQRNN